VRVALVCPYSLTVFGGVQSQVIGLAAALRELGVDTTVLAPGDDAAAAGDHVEVVGRAVGIPANGSVAPISPWPSSWARTLRAVSAGSFDVVHVHEPFVPGPTLAAVMGSRVPVVGTFHQSGWRWPYRVAFPLVRLLGRRLAASVAVSESAAEMVRRPLGRQAEVLWNGVPPLATSSARFPKTGPTVAFVGRHEERKGLEVLLRAMAHLGAEVHMWVMGEGPLTADLKAAYGDARIEWLGRVTDSERDARLAASDVYCAPNLGGESFGLVLAEAMAAGAPVVASDLVAFRAVARPERDEAILVAPGDPVALAAALDRVLSDESLAASLRSAGRDRAAELSMDRLAGRYLDIYRRVRQTPPVGGI
jgi:phosphatidylinositol alpha-mannosyltransferase